MRSLFVNPLLILFLCSCAQYSFASTPMVIEITDSAKTLPVEVGDVDQKTTSSFVQTINAENIRDTQLDVSQLIANVSGIKVRQTGGIGSMALVSLRGKSSDQVMIYQDGVLLNNASGGSVDLSHISPSQIARIEIYKDVVPVEFSQVSNGGVVNIITHRSNKNTQVEVGAAAGSFDTYKANFNVVNQIADWQYTISANHIESDNDFRFYSNNGTPDNPDNYDYQHRLNNQFKQNTLIGKAKYLIDGARSLRYQGEYFSKTKHFPSVDNSPNTTSFINYENHDFQINYLDSEFVSKSLEMNIGAKTGSKDTLYDDRYEQINIERKLIDQNIEQLEGMAYLKYKTDRYELVSSTDLRNEKLDLFDYYVETNSRKNSRQTFSSGLQINIYLLDKKLIVSPAGRYFHSQDDFRGSTLTESGASGDLNKTFSTFSPQFGLRFQLNSDTTLKFNAGKYYRLPSYIELFGARGYIGSNESLLPEQGINADAGFEFSTPLSSAVLTKFAWAFAAFHAEINDEIVYIFNARGEGHPANNQKSTITGVENNFNLELLYDLELISNTTLQMPLNESDPDKVKQLAGRPLWSQSTRLAYTRTSWQLFTEHLWESSYYYDSVERLPSKEKSIVNLGVIRNLKKARLSLEINNVFNHEYKDYFFQVAPGVSMILAMNYSIN